MTARRNELLIDGKIDRNAVPSAAAVSNARNASLRIAAWKAAAPCALALASLVAVGCNINEPPPFDPRAIQRPERESAGELADRPMRQLPTTLESTYLPPARDRSAGNNTGATAPPPRRATAATVPTLETDRVLHLPLEEIIHRAVMNNIDVKVAGYNPAIEGTRATEAEARFDPTYFANVNFEQRDNESGFTNTATVVGGKDRAQILTGQTGVRQNLESGAQVELRYQTQRTHVPFVSEFSVNPNPFWENQLVFQITQPLLQNFGTGVNEARIVIARNNQRISLLDFRKQIEETTRDIEATYWQLVQAQADYEVNKKLLNETQSTAEILLKRMGQDVTRVQLSQANAAVEQRRARSWRAQRARVADLSDQLKRLMNDPDLPVTGGVLVLPADGPLEEAVHFNLQEEIGTALTHRFELGQQQYRVDSAEVARQFAKNQMLPQLNAVGQVGFQGLDNDFDTAWNSQMDFNNVNYQVGLQFEIPIGNRANRAQYRRAILQREQAVDTYRGLIEQVSLDVKTAVREVHTSWDEMVATRQARFAARDSLDAIKQREAGGEQLTPTFVQLKLQQQEQLADAARRENEAIANYNIAIARLEFAKGTLLKYNNVIMEEDRIALR